MGFTPSLLAVVVVLATVGAGMMSGLLFAFSSFVMRALHRLPAAQGMAAMQHINRLIINPAFFVVFFGTAIACLVLLVATGLQGWTAGAGAWRAAGALAYLLGPVGVTMAFNVPLNNHLARQPAEAAIIEWPKYVARWQRWNHLRTLLGVAATAMLAISLATD